MVDDPVELSRRIASQIIRDDIDINGQSGEKNDQAAEQDWKCGIQHVLNPVVFIQTGSEF